MGVSKFPHLSCRRLKYIIVSVEHIPCWCGLVLLLYSDSNVAFDLVEIGIISSASTALEKRIASTTCSHCDLELPPSRMQHLPIISPANEQSQSCFGALENSFIGAHDKLNLNVFATQRRA